MSSAVGSSSSDLFKSSLWGALRGLCVEAIIYPLEVVKIRQQCAPQSEICFQMARKIFKQEGASAFYRGMTPQLIKTSLKQMWCWPMITGIPSFLQTYGLGDMQQQVLTGLSIATVDAFITTPLERAKILSALVGKSSFSLANVYKEGWQGFSTYWTKRSINMITFLTAQKYLRDRDRPPSGQLSVAALIKTGIQVALILSLVSAPFDMANTLKQAQNLPLSCLFTRQGVMNLYRGWPINAFSLVVHNVASVILMEKLCSKVK
jgi:hypothetical protein